MNLKKLLTLICICFSCVIGITFLKKTRPDPKPSIVFVHLGPLVPSHLAVAVNQARLFNPETPIYLIANQSALDTLCEEIQTAHVVTVASESLPQNHLHKKFVKKSIFDRNFREGFWTFTTERFFYLEAFMKKYNLSHVFYLENDVMLYTSLEEVLPIFKKNYPHKMGAAFDSDDRCIPSIIYTPNWRPLELFTHFLANKVSKGTPDIQLLTDFQKNCRGKWIDHLPIVMSLDEEGAPKVFSKYFKQFQSIFDGAAIGQYLGGIDPRDGESKPGFISEECIFNPSHFEFVWEKDAEGREIPMMIYQGHRCKINNLHIQSKNLHKFRS